MKENDCVFCKIIAGEIPSEIVAENESCIAIRDINPQAPVHILVLPKRHIPNVLDAADDPDLCSALFRMVSIIADQFGLRKDGFRIVSNTGQHGCQSVKHLHIHILGGKQLSEKMN